jgi:hypothetical protein
MSFDDATYGLPRVVQGTCTTESYSYDAVGNRSALERRCFERRESHFFGNLGSTAEHSSLQRTTFCEQ